MNPNEAPTDNEAEEEKVQADQWFNSIRQQLKVETHNKTLLYSYDFLLDKPLQNKNQRFNWISAQNSPDFPKELPARPSSASNCRSSYSTCPTLDYELIDTLPSLPDFLSRDTLISLQANPLENTRSTIQFCLRGGRESWTPESQSAKWINQRPGSAP
ncbi:unnamed protein product [Blepharisma stoltei]|uniref:Uncharacterized protein n=1 Tax=Blepharisma stoltei TaxID=1481888 RepID=A0AAU9JB18_9CILI|nr:unnamed protein product [Blepharisma stoltei]